jgi:hypothetical protein
MKNLFPSSDNKAKGFLDIMHSECVDRCQQLHLVGMYIMFHLLMISHVRLGFIS